MEAHCRPAVKRPALAPPHFQLPGAQARGSDQRREAARSRPEAQLGDTWSIGFPTWKWQTATHCSGCREG